MQRQVHPKGPPRPPARCSTAPGRDSLLPAPLPSSEETGVTCRNQQGQEHRECVPEPLATTGHRLACIDPSSAACVTRQERLGRDTGFVAHSGGRAGRWVGDRRVRV